MSTARGNLGRNRPQKYQNRTAFKNDLHDKSSKTKFINSLQITGVCQRCKEKIDWKIKYKKYKPLTAPKKCTRCQGKTVKHAYHVICLECATKEGVCPKCCKKEEVVQVTLGNSQNNSEFQELLKSLPERKRRTLIRFINKQASLQKEQSAEVGIEADDSAIIKKIEALKLNSRRDGDLSDEFEDSDDLESDTEIDDDSVTK